MELDSDRRFVFPVPPDDVWEVLAATDEYREWWPWLTSFDADGLRAGDEWRCAVRAPVPYTLRFRVHLREVVRPTLVTARISGDLAGSARLAVAPAPMGCEVRLTSSLAPTGRAIAIVATVARPVARRGHDWVLDTGARQFRERVVSRA